MFNIIIKDIHLYEWIDKIKSMKTFCFILISHYLIVERLNYILKQISYVR